MSNPAGHDGPEIQSGETMDEKKEYVKPTIYEGAELPTAMASEGTFSVGPD